MRIDGWEKRLNDYLGSIDSFVWGKSDCCMFAVNSVNAITGIHHGKSYKYKSELGAAKILKKYGGVESIASNHLGEHKSPLLAKRGDVVSFDSGNGIALGICIGDKIAAMHENGLTFLPMAKAIKAWSV